MEEDNILKMTMVVDASGLKDFESKSVEAFSGVKKAVGDLTGFTTGGLGQMNAALKETAGQFNKIADAIGVSPGELKQILSYVREINREIDGAAKVKARDDAANAKAEADLYAAKVRNLQALRQLRNAESKQFADDLKSQNAAIRKSADETLRLMEQTFKSTGQRATSGFTSALSPGTNYGAFSNIAGAFGGGRGIGAIASGLDGGMAAGGGGAEILGGLAGGAAIAAVLAIVTAIKSLASALFDAGKSAVIAAGDYQVTTNAITLFAGSSTLAAVELDKLHEVARNTPGLSMESAEAGYRNLRALGFAADTARGLIAGLAKQKIISGADESSIQRVIVNLTQLSSNSNRASQDLREIFHALPSLRKEFAAAFGTVDPTKLAKEFSETPEAALKKLSDQLEKTKGVSGGLNDAFVKLNDGWLTISRAFGNPILDPLTDAIKNLTNFILNNKNAFRSWGEDVATVIGTVNALVGTIGKKGGKIDPNAPTALEVAAGTPLVEGVLSALIHSQGGVLDSALTAAQATTAAGHDKSVFREKLSAMKSDNGGALPGWLDAVDPTKTEKDKLNALSELKKDRQKADLADLKSAYTSQQATTANYYAVAEALLTSHLTNTKEEEIAQLKDVSALKVESLRTQLTQARTYFNAELKIAGQDKDKRLAISNEAAKSISKLQTDIKVETLKVARETATKEREILRDRRNEQVKSLNLQVKAAKAASDNQVFDLKRSLDKGNINAIAGYAKLRDITDDSYAAILASTQAAANVRLTDETLSAEARANLITEENQTELGLAEDHRRALLAIDDEQYAKQITNLKDFFSQATELRSSQSRVFAGLSSFFDPKQKVGQLDISKLDANVNAGRRVINGKLASANKNFDLQYGILQSLTGSKVDRKSYDYAEAGVKKASAAIDQLKDELNSFKAVKFPQALYDLETLGKDMASGKGGLDGFDKAGAALLKIKHLFETTDLDAQIGLTHDLLKLATDAKDSKGILTLNNQLKILGNKQVTLGITQQAEAIEQYESSFEGLTERIKALRSGDLATVLGVQDTARKNVAHERISLLEDNIELEYRLAHIGEDSADRYRNAWLNAILDIRKASEDAKVEMIASQVQIANQTVFNADVAKAGILKSMAGAKGYTEIFQDAFLGVTSSISTAIGGLLDKATASLGAFGHVLSNIATQLITMVTNRLMMKLLDLILPTGGGVGGTAPSASGGGGILKSIGSIFSGFGGGGGIGGTPNFGGTGGFFGGSSGGFGALLGGGTSAGSSISSTLSGSIAGSGISEISTAGVRGAQTVGTLGGAGASGGIMAGLGAMAPLLGFSLGSGLGGTSTLGHILGGVGGLAGGLAVGIGTGAIGGAGTTLGGIVAGLGGTLAATGILAAVAVPLIIGAIILGKQKQRRADEVTRTAAIGDAMTQLDQILKDVSAHKYSTGQEAIDAAKSVRDNYTASVSQLKDKKTRNIALKEVSDRINPRIEAISTAAGKLDADRKHFGELIPEFATGGIVPGQFGSPRLVLAHGGEIIGNLSQQTPAFLNAAAEAGIPGVRGVSTGGGNAAPLHVEVHLGKKMQNQLFVNGAESQEGYSVIVKQTGKSTQFRDK